MSKVIKKAFKVFKNTKIEKKEWSQSTRFCHRIRDLRKNFLRNSEDQCKILKKLRKIAKTSQQNVYSCCTKGIQEKLSFLARTTPNTTENKQITREDTAGKSHSKFNWYR